jgi:hypothetical protein
MLDNKHIRHADRELDRVYWVQLVAMNYPNPLPISILKVHCTTQKSPMAQGMVHEQHAALDPFVGTCTATILENW